jgi:hypothetical protein
VGELLTWASASAAGSRNVVQSRADMAAGADEDVKKRSFFDMELLMDE